MEQEQKEKQTVCSSAQAPGYATGMLRIGTLAEHLRTIERARRGGNLFVWTGDLRRNAYLRENLAFIEANKLAEISDVVSYEDQGSYVKIEWAESHNKPELSDGRTGDAK